MDAYILTRVRSRHTGDMHLMLPGPPPPVAYDVIREGAVAENGGIRPYSARVARKGGGVIVKGFCAKYTHRETEMRVSDKYENSNTGENIGSAMVSGKGRIGCLSP